MPSAWRYALSPLPVADDVKVLARTMTAPAHVETAQRASRSSSTGDASADKTMRRIVRGLRARVTEPELQQADDGPDGDPSGRN